MGSKQQTSQRSSPQNATNPKALEFRKRTLLITKAKLYCHWLFWSLNGKIQAKKPKLKQTTTAGLQTLLATSTDNWQYNWG